MRESNSVDLLIVAGVSELRNQLLGITPVNGGFRSSHEEVSAVGS